MRRALLILATLLLAATTLQAQESRRQLKNPTLEDLQGRKSTLPHWGRNYLLVFYVDPDRANLNKSFTDDMAQNGRIDTPLIRPIGVINLKDAPKIPRDLAYAMAEKRNEESRVTILVDDSHTLATEWGLGDCNNQFALVVVNLSGEAIFTRKGILSQGDIEAFYRVVEQIKGGKTTSLGQGSAHL
ncbi:MAG: hypothetical protein R3Y68_01750 [Rikenellaceae bacterium]